MNAQIGLFGGSFNPVHFGHLIAARTLREKLGLNQVCFLPSRRPPHKDVKSLADPHHRLEMVRLAIENENGFTMSDFDLNREGPCYTIDTIDHFLRQLPDAELNWIIGADSLMDLPTWHRASELVTRCSIITAARSGKVRIDPADLEPAFGRELAARLLAGVVETPVIDISSTDIRHRASTGLSIRYLVPEAVHEYISDNGLYRA